MTDTSVRDILKKLIELQEIDGKIYTYNLQLKEKPLEIQQHQEHFENSKAHLLALEEDFKQIQLKRKEFELEDKGFSDAIAKANADLSQIKTNKEYSAKISEIEHIKVDRSRVEELILLSYDESDDAKQKIDSEKQQVTEEEKKFIGQKNEIEADIKECGLQVKSLEDKRESIRPDVEKNCLNRYERILRGKEGIAIVALIGNTCGGCYMVIQPQMLNEIKQLEEIVECEMCSRMLYLKDEL